MKLRIKSALALALIWAAAGTAAAQNLSSGQVLTFPAHDGSLSPPSTLRMTETPALGAVQAPPVRDTPQSLQLYTQCRDDADRSATSAAAMREAVGRCLDALNQRRAQGQ